MNVQTCFAQYTLFNIVNLLFISKSYIKNRPSDQFDENDFRARSYSQNGLFAQLFFPSILKCIHRFMFDIIQFCWMIFISIKIRSCSSAHRTFKNALTSNRKWKTQILNIIHRCCCNPKLRYIILMLKASARPFEQWNPMERKYLIANDSSPRYNFISFFLYFEMFTFEVASFLRPWPDTNTLLDWLNCHSKQTM